MRKLMKSYHVFLSSALLRWLTYFFYPLGMMFIQLMIIGISLEVGAGLDIAYLFSANLIFTVELFLEYFIFGGIITRDTNKLEYLKTSVKGMAVLKKGIIVGTIRRAITVALIQWIPWWLSGEKVSMGILVAYAWIMLMVELGCLVVRRITSFYLWFGVDVIGTSILPLALGVAMYFKDMWGLLIVYFAATILLIIYNVSLVMRKARESYYDVRTGKELEAD